MTQQTKEKILGAIAGITIGLQLIVRTAVDAGRVRESPYYVPILLALSATTFVAVTLIYLGRRSR
jgi:hypothetical protein